MNADERKKELVEALDAAISAARSAAGEALVVDAIERALHADAHGYDVITRWVRSRS